MRLADVNQGITVIDMRIPLPGLFESEVERVFLVVVLYELKGMSLVKQPLLCMSPVKRSSRFAKLLKIQCQIAGRNLYISIKLEGRTRTPKWNWTRCEKNWQVMF
ncbi:hypothetical protein Pyn_38935 [Prunus yedoensis var. nudiflora]|uniref:Uncharacterized protein n=1 Tax=Prunus yedoensis var. nudiflora TaxID=2094558 RepID=A0A314Y3U7_PRUYE|nr:hypothetical protein Pyn_38935 [Prunus yedoensis var. nudiflora]